MRGGGASAGRLSRRAVSTYPGIASLSPQVGAIRATRVSTPGTTRELLKDGLMKAEIYLASSTPPGWCEAGSAPGSCHDPGDEFGGLAVIPLILWLLSHSPNPVGLDVSFRAWKYQRTVSTVCPQTKTVGSNGRIGSTAGVKNLKIGDDIIQVLETVLARVKRVELIPHRLGRLVIYGHVVRAGNVIQCTAELHEQNLFLQSLCGEESANRTNGADQESGLPQMQITDKDRIECLENRVQYWTDFSKVQYHPRSMYELHGSWTDCEKFDNYGIGEDTLSISLQSEEMNERLRFFIEECDCIQGIQFIVDDSGGFSAIAASFLEDIADDYSNTPVLLYSARSPASFTHGKSSKESVSRALHDAVSFSRLSSFCKLMIPLGLPSLSRSNLSSTLFVEDQKLFHCSAIYAASVHSVSIPFRMESQGVTAESAYISGATDVGEMVQMLTGHARQNMITILDLAMPFPSLTGENNQSILPTLCSLTPEIEENGNDLHSIESLIIHGALSVLIEHFSNLSFSGGRRVSVSEAKQYVHTAYQNAILRPMFCHISAALCPLPIPLPFPSIFNDRVGRKGELSDTRRGEERRGSLEVDSVPMAARLRSSSAVKPLIERRLGSLRRYGLERGSLGAELLRSWGFGREEVEEMGESLAKMVMLLYSNTYASSQSDSD
ncbi:hypothetical protein KSP39_PZI010659 [Platanthera zijinensis]|uniref:DML1/Misato tubulin domain-containing protein n=1 Tax=Platanthera zijinensis TaxID=2320716 RepID=A0AAP0BK25_9ASPA